MTKEVLIHLKGMQTTDDPLVLRTSGADHCRRILLPEQYPLSVV